MTQPKSFVDFVTQVKNSVSDGKSKVASAITDKGVATEATDTFDTMAENIGKIQTGISLLHNIDGTVINVDCLNLDASVSSIVL